VECPLEEMKEADHAHGHGSSEEDHESLFVNAD